MSPSGLAGAPGTGGAYGAAVFDFNGTLYWDTALHNRAWDLFLEGHGFTLTDAEKDRRIHGRNNQDIFRDLFAGRLSESEVRALAAEKEVLYRGLCVDARMTLAPGAPDFLDFLKARGTAFTIATASERENVDFYFETLGLDRWFAYEAIVYNDGRVRSKPDPEVFRIAMRTLGVGAAGTVIFEDSEAGIRAALSAGAGKVVVVDPAGTAHPPAGTERIRHFGEVDRSMFGAAVR